MSTAIPALLAATGLQDLEEAVRAAASAACDDPRPCFCGADSTGDWKLGDSRTWGCEAHLRPLLELQEAE